MSSDPLVEPFVEAVWLEALQLAVEVEMLELAQVVDVAEVAAEL